MGFRVLFCPSSREHLIRLQHENKMLKLAQEGSDNEKIALLQSLLEDANRRKSELETENRCEHQHQHLWRLITWVSHLCCFSSGW